MGVESEHVSAPAPAVVPVATPALPAGLQRSPQAAVLALQRSHGNAAVARFLDKKPPKLSPRFDGEVFEQISKGRRTLAVGARGPTVTRLEQALVDAGHPVRKVDEAFDKDTKQALAGFQTATGLPANGTLDKQTLLGLNTLFESREPYVESAEDFDVHDQQGRELGDDDRKRIHGALVPDAKGAFKEKVGSKHYGEEIRARLREKIDEYHEQYYESKKDLRKDPKKNFHSWNTLEQVAAAAKRVVDDLYDELSPGKPPPAPSHKRGTLNDEWATSEKKFGGMNEDNRHGQAWSFMDYLVTTTSSKINQRHNAVPSNPAEKAIIEPIVLSFIDTPAKVAKILEIRTAWPGTAFQGKVGLQRFKQETDEDNRQQLWELFHICIHEYLHTLAHPRWFQYADKFWNADDTVRYNTLVEGFCDFFTETTRKTVKVTPELRERVEGPYYEEGAPMPNADTNVYKSIAQAEKVVSIAGIRNAELAYFRGDIDKIGG